MRSVSENGAIKEKEEVKVEVKTLRQALEDGMDRDILETHDVLAWTVPHAADTIDWYCVGTGGKTTFQRRTGKVSSALSRP